MKTLRDTEFRGKVMFDVDGLLGMKNWCKRFGQMEIRD